MAAVNENGDYSKYEVNNYNRPTDNNEPSARFKDEKGNSIMSPELQKKFGAKIDLTYLDEICDKDGNVKQGFEIFDLNGDGKIDNIEMRYLEKNNLDRASRNGLTVFLDNMDKSTSKDNIPDGIITKKDKAKIYKQEAAVFSQDLHNELENNQVKNSSGNNVVSDEIKSLFANGKNEMSLDDVVDSSGNIKQGFELFDLNQDGKLDDLEKRYFSGAGRILDGDKKTISIDNFVKTVKLLDKFSVDGDPAKLKEDKLITDANKKELYNILSAVYDVVENIAALPEEVRQSYLDAINQMEYVESSDPNPSVVGENYSNTLSLKNKGTFDNIDLSVDDMAITTVHELTHYIINRNKKVTPLENEVEAYYMESQFVNGLKQQPDFQKRNGKIVFGFEDYAKTVEEKRKQNPDKSDKQVAVEAFLDKYYQMYVDSGYKFQAPDELKNTNDYYSLNGVFRDKK